MGTLCQFLFFPLVHLLTRFSDAVDEPWDLEDPLLAG